MKTLLKTLLLAITSVIIFNCSKDDENSNANINPLLGQWQFTSGDFIYNSDKYVYFNSDNTVDILRQTDDNFKGIFSPDYSITNNQVTIDGVGGQGSPGVFDYSIEENTLTLTGNTSTITFQKINNAPVINNWIETLSILNQGTAPWEGSVDIAFTHDKSSIVYGKTNDSDYIALIDPETFEETGQIATTNSASAVEIEKFDLPDRYVFQSNNGSDTFHAYFENTNSLDFDSIETGAWIKGLASVNFITIWVASSNESSLYLYDYGTSPHTITQTINISIQPNGLDYQDGFLYVCDGQFLHKCQVTPNFEVLKSYKLDNIGIDGIAFDGNNFWISGYNYQNDNSVIVKTSLTL